MYLDAQNTFSREQAVTASAASTDVIDLGSARAIGVAGKPLDILVTVTEAALAAGAATVVFALEESADNSTYTSLVSTTAIGKADLVIGKQIPLRIPANQSKRYLRVYYTVATGPLTAGKFSAGVVEGIQANTSYPDAL